MKPCKHLDHNEKNYPGADLVELDGFSCPVKYWNRYNPVGEKEKVQFCKLRGRVKGIFQCYNKNELHCYEP